jgi:hypothetical protein
MLNDRERAMQFEQLSRYEQRLENSIFRSMRELDRRRKLHPPKKSKKVDNDDDWADHGDPNDSPLGNEYQCSHEDLIAQGRQEIQTLKEQQQQRDKSKEKLKAMHAEHLVSLEPRPRKKRTPPPPSSPTPPTEPAPSPAATVEPANVPIEPADRDISASDSAGKELEPTSNCPSGALSSESPMGAGHADRVDPDCHETGP